MVALRCRLLAVLVWAAVAAACSFAREVVAAAVPHLNWRSWQASFAASAVDGARCFYSTLEE